MSSDHTRVSGSYKDPGGFLFWRDGVLYRQINQSALAGYEQLMHSGLYDSLVESGQLISHEEAPLTVAASAAAVKIIRPRVIPFISYPYEWSFSQLRDAALLTLDIQEQALKQSMCLKDASAFNVQFAGGRPVFIDTLSFDAYQEGRPWVAYGQFCRHFLAPLLLMTKVDISLNSLLLTHIDGIPLSLAKRLTRWTDLLRPSLAMHIGLHARSEAATYKNREAAVKAAQGFTKNAFRGLLDSLRSAVNSLSWKPAGTEWADYYSANNNYGDAGLRAKDERVEAFVARLKPAMVWDLGGNVGRFSRLAAKHCEHIVCFDVDPACVEANYLQVREHKETNLLPLLLNFANPSPAIGWDNTERSALLNRGPADLLMALGLIHHLAIGLNVPLEHIAATFRKIAPNLIIEFVPRGDSQIDKLLSTRADIFEDYTQSGFESAFGKYYELTKALDVAGTARRLYLMKSIH